MSDERADLLENASTETATETAAEIDAGEDWELAVEKWNALLLEETPKLTDLIRQHLYDLGNRYIEIREQAAASGAEKKLRSFMRREMKASIRKDIETGCKLVEWEKQLDRPEETEIALRTIFSEVGLGVGFGLLGKLPDTYSKPNVRATDTGRRKQVAIAILDELVNDVTQANETDPKNDLVVARVGNLIKTFTLPEVGDRVEFDKTTRGMVVEHVDGEGEVLDGAIVRIDGSGEEKLLLRGEKKFTEEPLARLHEAAIVRGDNSELYGHTVVVQNYEPGDSELVEVLCLDGTSEKIPVKDLVRAKPKDAKVVGDLLHLVSEKGHLDKIKLAVERAEKPLLRQIDELRASAETSYGDGQVFAASRLSEVQPEVFVGAFAAMPSDKQAIVLAQIVPKAPPPPLDGARAIEIQASGAAPAEDTVAEIQSESVSKIVEAPHCGTQVEIVAEKAAVGADRQIETPEPELDSELVNKAEEILKAAFDTYRANNKLALARKNSEPMPESPIATYKKAIENNPEVKTFLAHPAGSHFLAAIASEPWGGIVDYIKGHWTGLNVEAICDRIRQASIDVYQTAELYRAGNVEAIKQLDPRLKAAAQYGCLSKEERLAIGKKSKSVATKVKTEKQTPKSETIAVHPAVRARANIDEIRDWLLTSTFFDTAIGSIKGYELKIEEVISSEQLQVFANQSREKADHAAQILKALGREDYLNVSVSKETRVDIASPPAQETNNNQDEEISW